MNEEQKLLPLSVAVEAATGARPNLATILRWVKSGAKGIKLKSVMLGGRHMTSIAYVKDFVELTTRASKESPTLPKLPTNRTKSLEQAKADFESLSNRSPAKRDRP